MGFQSSLKRWGQIRLRGPNVATSVVVSSAGRGHSGFGRFWSLQPQQTSNNNGYDLRDRL